MAFVKLDCRTLDSSLWPDHEACRLFFTALMMAVPKKFESGLPQIAVDTLEETGFVAPPGWYGFVEAAGVGIVRRAMMDEKVGLAALVRLGSAEEASRSSEYEGRRMIRVNGGYLILNYWAYREKDHTAAIRQKRHRAKSRPRKRSESVRADNDSRERRAAAAYDNGDEKAGDRIAAEGLPNERQD